MSRVFLSYARNDDTAFVHAIYDSLIASGFGVWWDEMSMPSRALTFHHEIRVAIDACDRVLLVLGSAALESDYVQSEWRYALTRGAAVTTVLLDVEPERLPEELEDFHAVVAGQRPPADVFADAIALLKGPVPPLAPVNDVPAPPPHFLLRQSLESALATLVYPGELPPDSARKVPRCSVLYGMSGCGKSTVAAAFANSLRTRRAFSIPDDAPAPRGGGRGAAIAWIPCGPNFQPLEAAARLMRALELPPIAPPELDARLRDAMAGRSLLLVLDDVTAAEHAQMFVAAADVGSRILCTTLDAGIATTLGAISLHVDVLSRDESLSMLKDWVGGADLPVQADQVAAACGDLAFAIAITGAMVRDGQHWSTILRLLAERDLESLKRKFPTYPHPHLFRALDAAVAAAELVEPQGVMRYLELAVFRPSVPVPESVAVRFWSRDGLAEAQAAALIPVLERRSLIRFVNGRPHRAFTLHHLQADYVRLMAEDLPTLHRKLADVYRREATGGWASVEGDGYVFENLAYHLSEAGLTADLYSLSTREWMQARLANTASLWGFSEDIRLAVRAATSERPLNLAAIVRGALIQHTIGALTDHLPPSIVGSLAAAGDGARALEYAGLLRDTGDKDEAYYRVARELASTDERRLAGVAAAQVTTAWRRWILDAILAGHVAAADRTLLDVAVQSAIDEDDEQRQRQALVEIVRDLLRRGQVAVAAGVIGRLRLSRRMEGVAAALCAAGSTGPEADFLQLLDLAAALTGDARQTMLIEVTRALQREGPRERLELVAVAAARLPSLFDRATVLNVIALGPLPEPAPNVLSTVERTLAEATAAGDLQSVQRLAVLHLMRIALSALATAGRRDDIVRALASVLQVVHEDDTWALVATRAQAAEILALIGEHAAADGSVQQALVAAERSKFVDAPGILNRTVQLLLGVERLEAALDLASKAPTNTGRTIILADVAVALSRQGRHNDAVTVARNAASLAAAVDVADKAVVLARLGWVFSNAGLAAESAEAANHAFDALSAVTDVPLRIRVIAAVVQTLGSRGEVARRLLTEADQALGTMTDADERPFRALDVLDAARSIGAAAEHAQIATRIAGGIPRELPAGGSRESAQALVELAAEAGDLRLALGLARQLPPAAQAKALGGICERRPDPKAIPLVQAAAERLADANARAIALDRVARAFASVSNHTSAQQVAAAIDHVQVRPQTFAALAYIWAREDRTRWAKQCITLASDALKAATDGAARARTLKLLAGARARTSDRRASETVEAALEAAAHEPLDALIETAHVLLDTPFARVAVDKVVDRLAAKQLNSRVSHMLLPAVSSRCMTGRATEAAGLLKTLSHVNEFEFFDSLLSIRRFEPVLDVLDSLDAGHRSVSQVILVARAVLASPPVARTLPLVARMIQAASGCPPSADVATLYVQCAQIVLRAGEADQAVTLAQRGLACLEQLDADGSDTRIAEVIGDIADVFERAAALPGDIERLTDAAASLEGVEARIAAIDHLVTVLLRSDRSAAAALCRRVPWLLAIENDTEVYAQAQALRSLSEAASRLRRMDLARALARRAVSAAHSVRLYLGNLGGTADRDGAIADAARALALAGEPADALELSRTVMFLSARLQVVLECVRRLRSTRERRTARDAAREALALLDDSPLTITLAYDLCVVAEILKVAGLERDAEQAVRGVLAMRSRFRNSANRSLVWSTLAATVGRGGDRQRGTALARAARRALSKEIPADQRIWALLGNALVCGELGMAPQARRGANEALQIGKALEGEATTAGEQPAVPLRTPSLLHAMFRPAAAAASATERELAILACAAAVRASVNDRPEAVELARRAVDIARRPAPPQERAIALANAARITALCGESDQTLSLLGDAFTAALDSSRLICLQTVELAATCFPPCDAAVAESMSTSLVDVLGWWPLPKPQTEGGGLWHVRVSVAGREPEFE